jgi:hypothetical protein
VTVAALPAVCLKLILRHFTLRQLSAAAAVCRNWRALAEEHLSLLTHLDVEQLGPWREATVEQARAHGRARARAARWCRDVGAGRAGLARVWPRASAARRAAHGVLFRCVTLTPMYARRLPSCARAGARAAAAPDLPAALGRAVPVRPVHPLPRCANAAKHAHAGLF